MKSPQKLIYAAGLGLLLSTATLLSDEMSAKEIAKKAYDALDSQQSYAFNAAILNHSDEGENTHQVDVKVNRPGQFRVDVTGDIRNRNNYLNDGVYTVYDHDKNMYVRIETEKEIDDALDDLFDRFEISSPLAQLMYTDMGDRIKFDSSKNFGIVDLKGVKCHYLAFTTKANEVHVWITAGETPVIINYMIKDKTSKNNTYKATTLYWKKASTISANDFIFAMPKNATEVFIK